MSVVFVWMIIHLNYLSNLNAVGNSLIKNAYNNMFSQNIINCPLCRHEILIRPLLKHFIHRKEFIFNIILCIQYIYLNVILLFFFFHYTYNLPRRSIFNFFTNVFMIFLISNTTFTMVTIFKDILKKTYILLS